VAPVCIGVGAGVEEAGLEDDATEFDGDTPTKELGG
jgi:hypothetical protein